VKTATKVSEHGNRQKKPTRRKGPEEPSRPHTEPDERPSPKEMREALGRASESHCLVNIGPSGNWEERSGDTWHEFSAWLIDFRAQILGICVGHHVVRQNELIRPLLNITYPDDWVDNNWVERLHEHLVELDGREGKWWLEKAEEAWRHLGTSQNRRRALELLHDAAKELAQEIQNGPQFWKVTKERRQAQYRALQKAREKVKKTVNAAGHALVAYHKAAMTVEAYPHRAKLLEIGNASLKWFEKSYSASEDIRKCLEELQHVADRVQQMANLTPFAKNSGRRGRREKSALSAAILGLESMFLLSRNKAREYTHSLLYVTGVWSDPDPHGLAAKSSQLRKRSTL
jgi:hypothetical protein